MEKPSTTPYLTTRQAAQELGVSLRTAQVWVERGLLEAWKTEGGHRRITVESVERLKKENPLLPDEISGTNAGATEKLKVLAIDDDKILARLYKLKLEAFPFPVEVLTASNAIEGLLLLGRESPDLLITDVVMPGLDGYTMVKVLCQSALRDGLEIVIVTGTPLAKGEQLPHLPPDIQVLAKPVPFNEIQRICENILLQRKIRTSGGSYTARLFLYKN